MHIKQLTVRGFKTYKDVATVNLGERYNAIVGLNGSGKSNLLAAIQFIISEIQGVGFDRNAFLHEGASTKVLSAYVEIVFDNSDRRLSMFDRDEVTIRRTFGHKKDEFLLDDKHVSKSEFQGIMESAGFNKTNPYYIVRQGKVMELTTMTDPSRLKLLREIAGTRVYDERRHESFKTLEDTKERKLEIDRMLCMINGRIDELTADQRELKEFQVLERKKRCIEFVLSDLAWREASDAASKHDALYREAIQASQACDDQIQAATAKREKYESERTSADDEGNRISMELLNTNEAMAEVRGELIRAGLESSTCQEEYKVASAQQKTNQKRLEDLKCEYRTLQEKEDCELKPAVENVEKRLSENQMALRRTQQERTSLYAKQNRAKQYSSKEERDSALTNEIRQIEEALQKRKADIEELKSHALTLQRESGDAATELKTAEQLQVSLTDAQHELSLNLVEAEDQTVKVTEERRTIQSALSDVESNLEKTTQEKNMRRREVYDRMGMESRAHECVKQWAYDTNNAHSVFGTLLENITVDEDYHVAIEVAGERQLFSMLVADQDIGGTIIALIKQRREGRISVTPLADIRPRTFHYPQGDERVVPLIECIEYPPHVKPAVESVFGRFLLCENIDVCRQFAKEGFDCITVDGDKVTRKGTVSGGYAGQSIARIRSIEAYRTLERQENSLKDSHRKLESQLQSISQRGDTIYNETLKLQKEKGRNAHQRESNLHALHAIKSGEEARVFKLRQVKRTLVELEKDREINAEQILRLRSEVVSLNLGDLTEEDESRLRQINEEYQTLQTEEDVLRKELTSAKNNIDAHNIHVKGTLLPEIEGLERALSNGGAEDEPDRILELEASKGQLERRYKTVELEKKRLEQAQKKWSSNVERLRQEVEKVSNLEAELKATLKAADKDAAYHRRKLEDVLRRQQEADRRRLALPGLATDFAEYESLSKEQLTKEVATVTGKLQTYTHVNKKALDQFSNFIDEQARLSQRRSDLDQSEASIVELMESLDQQKDDTLLRTFENVNKHFGRVFGELVPRGRAALILKKMNDSEIEKLHRQQTEANEIEKGATKPSSKLDIYTGVGIKASFTGQDNAYFSMQQLSGGQKTVVALSLIFAVQECDPAPFYLFDEIDAALDDQYRGAIANLCSKNSASSQFIMTTFRSQLLEPAQKFFKVTARNRCSNVREVTLEEAKSTIQEQQSLEGA